ncbi:MAG: endonuclease/exonuclease/phosphatase family protein [Bacteroidia bacterium]|nr:endonuclease/exonuclease/phosphatase family protein [Bacteroidia bacterium]
MKNAIKKIGIGIAVILYIIPLLASILGVLAPYLPVGFLTFAQMIPPSLSLLSLINLLFFLFFITRSIRWGIVSAIAMGLTLWTASQEVKPFSKAGEEPTHSHLKVVSLNVAGFAFEADNVDKVASLLKEIDADVITLQEFRYHKLDKAQFALGHIAKALQIDYFRFDHRPGNLHGAATFSKYPIVQVDTLFMSRGQINTGIISTIESPIGKVGVANIHLTSYGIKPKLIKDKSYWEKAKELYKHGIKVVKDQQDKVDQVLEKTKSYPYPLVVAGDLNAAPHSRIVHHFRKRFQDSFIEQGAGSGFTYPIWGPYGLRIDYQFAGEELQIHSHEIVRKPVSDHYPVVVCYSLNP